MMYPMGAHHVSAMKAEPFITPQQEIGPVIEHGYGMGHSLQAYLLGGCQKRLEAWTRIIGDF